MDTLDRAKIEFEQARRLFDAGGYGAALAAATRGVLLAAELGPDSAEGRLLAVLCEGIAHLALDRMGAQKELPLD